MKKKLAIFTAAVGFFTLCNVILYTRKLRADEMVSFWRWSITAAEASIKNNNNNNNNNYSAYLADDQQQQLRESNNVSVTRVYNGKEFPVYSVISVGQKQRVLSSVQGDTTEASRSFKETNSTVTPRRTLSDATAMNNFVASHRKRLVTSSSTVAPTTFHNRTLPSTVSSTLITTGSSWSLVEAIMNRTYHYNVNDSTACVEVSFNHRNLSVTFNLSLIEEQYGLESLEGSDMGSNSEIISNGSSRSGTTLSSTQMSPLPPKSTYHVSRPPDGIVTKGVQSSSKKGLSPLNEHPFSYLVNVEDLCSNPKNLTLVILVTTAIGHAAQRQAIRDTWGGLAKSLSDVRLAFLVGMPEHPRNEVNILQEALQHADIIQEDFVDTYKNLTLKTVMLLKWANTYCSNTRYVMKTDDDMFIHIPNLLKYLRSLRYSKGQLLGRLVKGARPLRSPSSKYYVPVSEYKDRIYPDYLSGTAYVMSSDVVPRLYSTSRITPIFFFEDVFVTGICAKKAKVIRRNHSGFVYYKRPVRGCAYLRAISGHDNTPNDLRRIWRELQRKNLKC